MTEVSLLATAELGTVVVVSAAAGMLPASLSKQKRNLSYVLALEDSVVPTSPPPAYGVLPSPLTHLPRFPLLTPHNAHISRTSPRKIRECKSGPSVLTFCPSSLPYSQNEAT